jgi:O-succinylbenzoic acid--CoA ligase
MTAMVPDPIARHAAGRPDAVALTAPGRQWTYASLHAELARIQARLQRIGVEAGDRVGLHHDRPTETVRLLWALWRMGAVAVPLSRRLPPAEVGRQARRVGCARLLTADEAVLEAAPEELSTHAPGALFGTEGEEAAEHPPPADRPATIVYTSGSTGPPKAALHTWANHLYSAKGANANLPLRPGDRWLLSLPLYHVGGLAILVRCALTGAAVAVPGAGSIGEQVRTTRATHVSLVATQLRRLLDATTGPPPTVAAVLLGGGPIPNALLEQGTEQGWPLLTSYGSTEMASQIATTPPGAPLDTLRTAGRRLPHRRLRIRDGEIQVAGAPLFRGYVTADGREDPRTEDGWYRTGDRGTLDASGRLRVLGRTDRMFVSGGENIQPEEIERALERQEGVERAVVVSVPDPEYGRRPVAFIRGEAAATPAALRAALRDHLPGFKIPDALHFLPSEAESKGLKVDRDRLRDRARALRHDRNHGNDD